MNPSQITDDLEKLLERLPIEVQQELSTTDSHEDLLEVILDLGRLPEARYSKKVKTLGNKVVSRSDLEGTIKKLGKFGADNRAGIEGTLHRISAIRNRHRDVVGLTCRVGRAVFGTVVMVRDLIESGESILLMGKPGVGKTTALREIARVLADELGRRVVVIDTSNEIAGDGDIPHPAIGRARRMQVSRPEHQHQMMIEAVENHMPEVIVIDEIGTELETHAARTIAERGVQLIATAHGNALANLIKNPTLCDLVGGIQSVTLGDEEARRRRTQKTVLERASEPTFPIAVEINSRSEWSIHKDVGSTVDLLLRGQSSQPQERTLSSNGEVQIIESKKIKETLKRPLPKHIPIVTTTKSEPNNSKTEKISQEFNEIKKNTLQPLQILCHGITRQIFDEAIRRHNWPIIWEEQLEDADVLLTIRHGLSQNRILRNLAQQSQVPIHVIKSNTIHQIERAMKRLLDKHQGSLNNQYSYNQDYGDRNDEVSALEECRLALEKIVVPLGKPVELLPRSSQVIQMQSDLVERYCLKCDVFGDRENQHLRVYPP